MNFMRTRTFSRNAKFALAATAALFAATSSSSQTVPESSAPQNDLNIPEQLTIFGQNDPNVRRATASVNGDIITGTDVGHRLALIVEIGRASCRERAYTAVRSPLIGTAKENVRNCKAE